MIILNNSQFAVFKRVLTVAPEQQPCGAQVVEWVGLVASSSQFITRLAAVFADHHQRKEGSKRRLIHVAS
jgi:hypothetical protein